MANSPSPKRNPEFASQIALALELPILFIGSVVIGGGLGWLLDRKFRTGPWLMLLGGLLGFVGGFRELLRRLNANGGPTDSNPSGASGGAPTGKPPAAR
jgi:F0F1-type ATP synthase assembly protein I